MSIKSNVTIDETIVLLNQLLELDKSAVFGLVNNRVPCNGRLAEHPTVQVAENAEVTTVGILGIINGLFGVDAKGMGAIMFVADSTANTGKFIRTSEYKPTT